MSGSEATRVAAQLAGRASRVHGDDRVLDTSAVVIVEEVVDRAEELAEIGGEFPRSHDLGHRRHWAEHSYEGMGILG